MKMTCLIEPESPDEVERLTALGINSIKRGKKIGFYCDLEQAQSVAKMKPPVNAFVGVKQSKIHGKGAFAKCDIKAGDRLIEYTGRRMTFDEAMENMPHDPNEPNHTFLFTLEGGNVIEAYYGGNESMWINHSCAPNLEAQEVKGRVWLHALRDIRKGEELYFDYALEMEGTKLTAKVRKDYECRCGAPNCRGTMLAWKAPNRKAA